MVVDPIAAVDLNAAVDPSAAVVLSVMVQNVAPTAVVVHIAAAPWVIHSVQKRAHVAIRILVETSVQTVAAQNAVVVQNVVVQKGVVGRLAATHAVVVAHSVVAEFRYQHGFFRASLLPPASLA